jgi:1,4-dihydroxy-2-naphthoyl-CoA hydrolase
MGIERLGLRFSFFIQVSIHATPLNNIFQVVIGLSMPDQIDFFDAQFSFILPLPFLKSAPYGLIYYSGRRKNIKIVHSSTNRFSVDFTMSIFISGATIESLNEFSKGTLSELIGIQFTDIGDDFLEARMPVDARTHQPMGLLHGGASVALAETLGSVAATLCIDQTNQFCVGLEINANHIKGVRSGFVTGTARPFHIGKKTQVWEIKITNEQKELICVSRITMAVLEKK